MTNDFSVDKTNEYLAQLGHEMRTPLHSISGFTHMLSESCHTDDEQAWLRNIRTASKHLLDLVNDIIDVNRLSSQLIEIADEQVDIYTLILDIISTLQPQTNLSQLNLKVTIDSNCFHFWRGDKRKLKKIFINIISNAIKFTPPQGIIQVSINENHEGLSVSVKDSGVGMNAETLKHLFQPYFHSHSRINQQGTGLGLTITRRLVELMNGKILISSQLNKGSEFIITLPLTKDKNAQIITNEIVLETLTEITHILLVDDAPLHHEVLIGMVKNLPIIVHSAFSVAQTLKICPEINPDLVLIDYRLPDGDGINLARTLKNCNNHLNSDHIIKLALLTAHHGSELQEALAEHTLDAILYKPLELSELIQLVAQCHTIETTLSTTSNKPKILAPLNNCAPDYLQALWPEFYISLEEGITECQQYLTKKRYKELANSAHRLKGQAMIFHHHRLWQEFEALEALAQAHNHTMAIGVLNQILQTYQEEKCTL
jgi:CheY-like chemotaxis protein/two-component sensor histidine kinase